VDAPGNSTQAEICSTTSPEKGKLPVPSLKRETLKSDKPGMMEGEYTFLSGGRLGGTN